MRHGMVNKKLNRTSEHRKALLKNMLNSLIKYELKFKNVSFSEMLKLEKVTGSKSNAEAKIAGITPAWFILSGK